MTNETGTSNTTQDQPDWNAINERLQALETENAGLRAQVYAPKQIKLKEPGPFTGKPGTLKPFLTELQIHHRLRSNEFQTDIAKVLHAATCCKDAPQQWLEPKIRNYFIDPTAMSGNEREIIEDFEKFEEALKSIYGHVNEEQEAIQKLQNLKQQGSASAYGSLFVQISSILDWDPQPLMEYFYQGLKEEVKDELCKTDRPDTLAKFIEKATKIDERIYQRRQERKGKERTKFIPYKANQKKPRLSTQHGATTHSGPMDLDAIEQRKIKCFNCNKLGNHISKNCPEPRRPRKNVQRQDHAGIHEEPTNHNSMHWTACYDDQCHVHKDGKDNGYYPKRKQATLAIIEEHKIGNDNITDQDLLMSEAMTELRQINNMIDNIPTRVRYLEEEDNSTVTNETTVLTPPETTRTTTPVQVMLPYRPTQNGLAERHVCCPVMTRDQFLEWEQTQLDQENLFSEHCGQEGWHNCTELFCADHAVLKLTDWHKRLGILRCGQRDFAQCHERLCADHRHQRETLYVAIHNLENQGYNFETHTGGMRWNGKNGASWKYVKQYHKLTTQDIPRTGCYWCTKYNQRSHEDIWIETHIDQITLGAIQRKNGIKLTINATIMGHEATVWIDTGATANYISTDFVNSTQVPCKMKTTPIELYNAEGKKFSYNNGIVDKETDHLEVRIQGRTASLQFDLLPINKFDAILGLTWLQLYNPIIDWGTGQLSWSDNSSSPNKTKL